VTQRALPIESPTRARVIIGIDPATTNGAAVALFCPSADRIAAGQLPGLLAAWIWRGSTAKAAGPAGLRLSAAACTPTGAEPIDGTLLHPTHAQIGALIAAHCAAMPLVVACEKPPPMGGFARSAGQIVWISGLVCGPILARHPEAQLLRPLPMQWRSGLSLPVGEKLRCCALGCAHRGQAEKAHRQAKDEGRLTFFRVCARKLLRAQRASDRVCVSGGAESPGATQTHRSPP